jgi:hypothetical protein
MERCEELHVFAEMAATYLAAGMGTGETNAQRWQEARRDLDLSEPLWDGAHAAIQLQSLVREDRRAMSAVGTALPDRPWTLRAEIRAYATAAAIEHGKDEAQRVVQALLRLALDLVKRDERPYYTGILLSCDIGQLAAAAPLIREWLGSYYRPKPGKRSLDWHVRNAIELVVEAGHQWRDAIAVPLLCAAIESLVGGGREATTKNLADYIATLLEPDASSRYVVISFVKKLCDDRSSVIHGGTTEVGAEARSHARILCAHLLRAVIDRT